MSVNKTISVSIHPLENDHYIICINQYAMLRKRTILVTGATGAQGGSVARALLQQGEFAVRILTRNPSSQKALELKRLGAEVIVGDMADEDRLQAAMDGCYGVFGITSYWEHFKREFRLGMNLVEAVAVSGIEHFVLHTMPDYKALSGGMLEVPHCDIKAVLKSYSQELRLPATYLQVSFYYENFLNLFPLKQDQFGTFQFGFPQGHTKLATVSVEDVGGIAARAFAEPSTYIGRTLTAVGADETCDTYAAIMTKVLGVPVHYNHVPRELYRTLGFVGAEELANFFDVQRIYISNRRREMEESYRMNPRMQPFESWLLKNKERFLAHFHYQQVKEVVY